MEEYESRHTGPVIDDAVDRAKEGGAIDKALSEKAPAGYGYGGAMKKVGYDNIAETTFESLLDAELASMPDDSAKQFRMTDHPTLDGTTRFAFLYKAGNNYATLVSWSYLPSAPSSVIKLKHNGAWKPWEWENPPMDLGVEYRTTERYMGKPVYVMACNFGALPNAATASASLGFSATAVISASGVNSVGESFPIGATTSAGSIDIYVNRHGGCWITTTTDHSSETATIIVKYIKD